MDHSKQSSVCVVIQPQGWWSILTPLREFIPTGEIPGGMNVREASLITTPQPQTQTAHTVDETTRRQLRTRRNLSQQSDKMCRQCNLETHELLVSIHQGDRWGPAALLLGGLILDRVRLSENNGCTESRTVDYCQRLSVRLCLRSRVPLVQKCSQSHQRKKW